MKNFTDQLRLYLSERLISWAVDIAPRGHPDSQVIEEAAWHVASTNYRRLANDRNR